jgi:hypothetical protein
LQYLKADTKIVLYNKAMISSFPIQHPQFAYLPFDGT